MPFLEKFLKFWESLIFECLFSTLWQQNMINYFEKTFAEYEEGFASKGKGQYLWPCENFDQVNCGSAWEKSTNSPPREITAFTSFSRISTTRPIRRFMIILRWLQLMPTLSMIKMKVIIISSQVGQGDEYEFKVEWYNHKLSSLGDSLTQYHNGMKFSAK